MSTTDIIAVGDFQMLLRSWEPEGEVRASVIIIHGLGDHSGRYEHVGSGLADAGFAVMAPDLRGFGASGGRRAFIHHFSTYLDDLDPIVASAAEAGVPVVLLGHSLGGLIALLFAELRQGLDLLVISSPSIDAEIPTTKRLAAKALRRILPGFSLPNGLSGEQLSRDPSVGEAYFSDPLVQTKTTAGLGGAMLEAMAYARSASVTMPTLIIHGEDDSIVPARFSAPLADSTHATRITFPGFRHESFNEEGGTEAIGVVVRWIDEQLAQSAS
jgi:alpha-beta hydrolase superfamily lysophospholipase